MDLNKNQWHVRWFFWSLGILDRFTGKDTVDRYQSRGTNLCHYMRVLLVWTPLVLLLHVAIYGSVIFALTRGSVYLYGTGGLDRLASYSGIAAAILVGFAFVVKPLWRWMRSNSKNRPPRPTRTRQSKPYRGPGFFSLLWEYIVAAKRRICPTISFNYAKQGGTR